MVHLDLKSSNVLIAADGTAKIADVGLSAQLQNASHLSSLQVAGTWAWVAPEVIMAGAGTCGVLSHLARCRRVYTCGSLIQVLGAIYVRLQRVV